MYQLYIHSELVAERRHRFEARAVEHRLYRRIRRERHAER
jgi:hypothetical protein